MKLVIVLMLTALPLACYAGSGCEGLEDLINNTIDPEVTEGEYIASLEDFEPDEATEEVLRRFKQCFLHQSNSTLSYFSAEMDAIYNSEPCASY